MRWMRSVFRSRKDGHRDSRQEGQTLVLVALGIFGFLAIVGLAVDLGLYYTERVKIVRAVDAAALAAAPELPLEQAAHTRALEFLADNGYDSSQISTTRLVINGSYISGPDEASADTVITLDTASFRDLNLPPAQQLNSANRIRVMVRQRVPIIFLRFIGFDFLSVQASATAENVNNLDVVLVFDRSGSMEFDTLCYGCWQRQAGVPYPGGTIYPLPWNGPANGSPAHCGATQEYTYSGYKYYYIEAEEYSRASNPYQRTLAVPYYTYWVMQRESGDGASGRDSRGAYIMHMPYSDHETTASASPGYGVTCRYEDVNNNGQCAASGYTECYCYRNVPGGPFPAPRVDYDFTVLTTGNYYIWVRGQAQGNTWKHPQNLDLRIFWNVDSSAIATEDGFPRGTGYNGASSGAWQWRRLGGPFYWAAGSQHTLRIWAGGAGFALDRIVITTNPNGSDGSPPSDVSRTGVWSNGRTDWACSPCDARFAGSPVGCLQGTMTNCQYGPVCNVGPNPDRRKDDIYDDEQPIRAAIEAAKRFVGMLDYRYDQIGYVSYATDVRIDSELQCLKRLGRDYCTPQVITNTVVAKLDSTTAGGGTNIAGGIKQGIEVLSTKSGHYGRPGAAHIMILMTDGRANVVPDDQCWQDTSLWPDIPGENTNERKAKDCVIYYTRIARNNSIVIYTITLGDSADFELMEAVADMTGGVHRNADRPEKLNQIFDELYERIFLRLVE